MTALARLALVPRDGLFCKDGRGWHTSASGRGHALDWPWPSTVLGALRTAWGREEESRSEKRFDPDSWRARTAGVSLGCTLVLRRPPGAPWSGKHRAWPVPSDALWLEECAEVCRLDPAPPTLPTLGRDDGDAREALWVPRLDEAAKPLPAPRWWSDESFAAWLAGRSVPARDARNAFELSRRVQVRVSIQAEELTANEGVLFSHDVVETLEPDAEWALGVEVVLPSGDTPAVATLGSDGRLARVETLPDHVFDPPEAVLGAFRPDSSGLRLVVVTPACFEHGWLPDGLERRAREFRGRVGALEGEVVLRAAMVPRPVHVSGWDMAAGAPKPTSRMVPPGTVYFFERADGRAFSETEARALWLAALGARTEEGFGRVVPGAWSPRRSEP
jgi:CRISPR-associated protein Cmr3